MPKDDKKEKKPSLEECQKEREEYLAGWQRARADFLNYKKEEMERMREILKYTDADSVLKILPILDSFELAERKLSGNLKEDENIKGFLQIKAQLQDFLRKQGVEEIKAIGKKFDPNFHEVVEEVEGKESGIIVEEVKKGYKLHNKVLRPSRVKISK